MQEAEDWGERLGELEEEMKMCERSHTGMLEDGANKDDRIKVKKAVTPDTHRKQETYLKKNIYIYQQIFLPVSACACAYIYIYIFMHTCTRTHRHTHIGTRTHTYISNNENVFTVAFGH